MLRRITAALAALALATALQAQGIGELRASYQQSLAQGDRNAAIYHLNKLALAQWEADATDAAVESYLQLYELAEQNGNRNAMRAVCTNLGLIFTERQDHLKAELYLRKLVKICEATGDKPSQADAQANLAAALLAQGKAADALQAAERALALATEASNMPLIRSCYGALSDIHKQLGNTDKTLEYFNLYAAVDQKLKSDEVREARRESQAKVNEAISQKSRTERELREEKLRREETQMSLDKANLLAREQELMLKEQQLEGEKAREEIRRQRHIRDLMLIGVAVALLFAGVLWRQISRTKKANRQLAAKNAEIQLQKDEIQKQSEKITASIQYASRIQTAILPPADQLRRLLPRHFVYFQPRDIVSGDFYWIAEKGGYTFVAVADCTGHGVPGALMSMLGISYLNEILNTLGDDGREHTAGDMLDALRSYVMASLHQTGDEDEAKDGMDISLAVIDKRRRSLEFAGANNPAYLASGGQITVIPADDMPVGYQREMQPHFATRAVEYRPGDILYMTSDGYTDQFGGPSGRKFMAKRFRQMLAGVSAEPFESQGAILRKTLEAWRGDTYQVDDILVMGVGLG